MLVLQRARNAKRIYATVVNSEINFVGERNKNFLNPHEKPFTELLERFYSTCGVDPAEIAYLEADGSGVKVGFCYLLYVKIPGKIYTVRSLLKDHIRNIISL